MSFSLPAYTTYSSAVRFSLSDVEPVEERYVKRIGSLKLIERVVKLIPKQPYSYDDYLKVFYTDVLSGIKVLKFRPEDVHKHMVKMSFSIIEKLGLSDQIKRLEELRGSTSPSDIKEAADIMAHISGKLCRMITADEVAQFYAKRFLNSNFFISYFSELLRGFQTYNKFLILMENEIRKMERFVGLAMKRGTPHAMKVRNEFRRKLRPIIDACDDYSTSLMTLKVYVELSNSEKIEDLFQPKVFSMDKLDKNEYERLFSDYVMKLDSLRNELFKYKPDIFVSRVNFAQPIPELWKKLVALTVES
jgi:hypothetical protein